MNSNNCGGKAAESWWIAAVANMWIFFVAFRIVCCPRGTLFDGKSSLLSKPWQRVPVCLLSVGGRRKRVLTDGGRFEAFALM
jgi:hypothetical protein